ncbi:MAG: hypothetical protein ABII82_17220 [Verrucomicrobiota bacterium]
MKLCRLLVISSLLAAFSAVSYAGAGCGGSCTGKSEGEKAPAPKVEKKES